MNTYLEQPSAWQDFHTRFIPLAAELLGSQVLPKYYVKIEEHLFIHEPSAKERFPLGRPDLSVHSPGNSRSTVQPASGSVVAAPFSVGMPAVVEEERLPYLEITDRASRKVVTILELLSPSNKQIKSDREQYLGKVRRILSSGINFVEIDFLRGGPRMPWERLPECDYYALVSRPADRNTDDPHAGLWPIRLRDPLPKIPIPLRAGEPEATLDLQAILHRIYDSAGYQLFIYDAEPEPALSAEDAVWAAQLLNPQP